MLIFIFWISITLSKENSKIVYYWNTNLVSSVFTQLFSLVLSDSIAFFLWKSVVLLLLHFVRMISIWLCCLLLSELQIRHLLLLLITINICIWDGSAHVSKPRWYYFCCAFVIVWVADKAFVQNVMNITRLLINPDIPEALQLKNGYVFLLYIYITLEIFWCRCHCISIVVTCVLYFWVGFDGVETSKTVNGLVEGI
jgi:hypothetical protein